MNSLAAAFSTVLGMSLTASYVAAGVMLARLLLRKAPRIFSYVLWSAVLFRLVVPISFPAAFSFLGLLNTGTPPVLRVVEPAPDPMGLPPIPAVDAGIGVAAGIFPPEAGGAVGVNPAPTVMSVLSLVWAAGIVFLHHLFPEGEKKAPDRDPGQGQYL
jgi:bla regulator protein BlaR1